MDIFLQKPLIIIALVAILMLATAIDDAASAPSKNRKKLLLKIGIAVLLCVATVLGEIFAHQKNQQQDKNLTLFLSQIISKLDDYQKELSQKLASNPKLVEIKNLLDNFGNSDNNSSSVNTLSHLQKINLQLLAIRNSIDRINIEPPSEINPGISDTLRSLGKSLHQSQNRVLEQLAGNREILNDLNDIDPEELFNQIENLLLSHRDENTEKILSELRRTVFALSDY